MGFNFGRLIVAFVLCLISFISYSSQIFIIWPWYGREWSVELLTLLVPFNVFVGILFYNYYLCVMIDPGKVPSGWRPDTHNEGYEVKKLTGEPRYCRMCQCYKPPRTHHCRDCNRCVLRMDHHCPWINNCIGYFNYSHFIRFLFYVDVACSYHLVMVSMRTLELMKGIFWNDPSATELVFLILNYVACVPVLLAVGGFSIYHLFNMLGNSTTIEGWEKDKVATMIKRGQIQEIKFPYDLGRMRNVKAVLGDRPLFWCIPHRMPGNGLKYELADYAVESQVWPPPEPDSIVRPKIDLSSSPFTYGEDSLNPSLRPTNIRNRSSKGRSDEPPAHAVPPYHPDYQEGEFVCPNQEESEAESDYSASPSGGLRIRRGSEGYEVKPQSREEMLRQYIEEMERDPHRYVRYEPEPFSESEDSEDDVPLAQAASTDKNA